MIDLFIGNCFIFYNIVKIAVLLSISPPPPPPVVDGNKPRLIFPLTLEDEITAWGAEGERERIIEGLQVIMDTLEESEMFCSPVDIEEEYFYCVVVPFPTDLSTILERLKNGFYRLVGNNS